jgi:hypothetical protein
MYFDLCRDGLLVKGTSIEQGGSPSVQFGADAPIPLPAHVRNLRAVLTPDGRYFAAWKGQDGRGMMTDRSTRIVLSLSPVYGDEAVALTPNGTPVSILSQTQYLFGFETRPMPPHRVGTSQGLASAHDDGTIVFGDDQLYADPSVSTRGPFRFVQWQDVGGWRIGKTDKGAIAWHEATQKPYVITDANTPWAIRGHVIAGILVCVTSLPGLVVFESDMKPWAPPVVPPPVVLPPVEKPKPPAFRRLSMEKLVGLKLGARFISSEPGHTDIEFRDVPAPTAWQKIRMIEQPDKHVRFEFADSGLTLCVTPNGTMETRPSGTAGPWETFIAGEAPSGERVAFQSSAERTPVFRVVDVV